jgi:hypothetical protein
MGLRVCASSGGVVSEAYGLYELVCIVAACTI